MHYKRVKITTTIPSNEADALRLALGNAGAGRIGDYTFCSFTITGKGRFLPNEAADPHVGTPNQLNIIEEEQIEVTCSKEEAKAVVAALKRAHPYEEPIIDIIPLISVDELR